jgi:lipopolysaccharide transport system ATP-binding protein
MSATAVTVERLGKRYRIGTVARPFMLREALTSVLGAPVRGARRLASRERPSASPDPIWAVKDVSFEIRRGDVVGIIGRNGAGKSTLLKLLSRITEPTAGRITIRGRVGSLLEVGTGFHPELTGRENITLNGAILGMKKAEITRKFDEIVSFAQIETHLDTPVKYYSSGMYMRLAFAVAAHLEPEILIVDEVLAVGDVQFQKRCLGKIGDVAREGRTVLLVSHQLNQVRRLCDKVMWLDGGRLRAFGDPLATIAAYEQDALGMPNGHAAPRDSAARFLGWEVADGRCGEPHVVGDSGPVTIALSLQVDRRLHRAHHGIALFDQDNRVMWATATDGLSLERGRHRLVYTFPMLPLRPGTYQWHASLRDADGTVVDDWYGVPALVVGAPPLGHPLDRFQGVLNLPYAMSVT